MAREPDWLEFHQGVLRIAAREGPNYKRAAAAEDLLAAIRDRKVKVRWSSDISEKAEPPIDWSRCGPILFTGKFLDALVCRADIDRLWPSRERAAQRPSRERPFWQAAGEAAFDWLRENGCPEKGDGNQARLEEHVTSWLDERGYEAGEATVRRHVVKWITEFRAKLDRRHGLTTVMSPS